MSKEEQYFEKKLNEVLDIMGLILSRMHDEQEVTKLKNSLKIKLKEVARDQRYACVEAIQSYYNSRELHGTISNVQGIIQNAQIDKE